MIARTSSSTWVRGVVEMFATEGIDVEALFRDARLNIAVLLDPAGRFSIDDVSLLWEMAVARSGNATLGLSRELALTYGKLGVVGHAMMACPTLLAALEQLARSMDVVSNAATFALIPDAEGHWFELGHLGGERPVPRQRVEFGMLTMLGFCSWITGRELQARTVEFVYPAPDDATAHLAVFGCPVRFGAATNRALLRMRDLELPLSARDPDMATLHARLVEAELERLDGAPTSHQVRKVLVEADRRRDGTGIAGGQRGERVFELPLAAAQDAELRRQVHDLLCRRGDEIDAFLLREAADRAEQRARRIFGEVEAARGD